MLQRFRLLFDFLHVLEDEGEVDAGRVGHEEHPHAFDRPHEVDVLMGAFVEDACEAGLPGLLVLQVQSRASQLLDPFEHAFALVGAVVFFLDGHLLFLLGFVELFIEQAVEAEYLLVFLPDLQLIFVCQLIQLFP